jgi:hypothetical protein
MTQRSHPPSATSHSLLSPRRLHRPRSWIATDASHSPQDLSPSNTPKWPHWPSCATPVPTPSPAEPSPVLESISSSTRSTATLASRVADFSKPRLPLSRSAFPPFRLSPYSKPNGVGSQPIGVGSSALPWTIDGSSLLLPSCRGPYHRVVVLLGDHGALQTRIDVTTDSRLERSR